MDDSTFLFGKNNISEKAIFSFHDLHGFINARDQQLIQFKLHKETRKCGDGCNKAYFG